MISIFLLAAGNQLSIRQPRAMNPAASFRSGASGRVQAILFVIYPIAFVPVGLAYLARYAFASEAAFFGVLAVDAAIGACSLQAVSGFRRGRRRTAEGADGHRTFARRGSDYRVDCASASFLPSIVTSSSLWS